MTQPNTITLETRGAIEILTLNRPDQLNAVTPDMIGELTDYFSALHDRPTTRVVILRGNGPEFSAGAELGSDAFAAPGKGRPQRQLKMQQNYSGVVRLMRSCPQPIIGLVHGAACGAGFSFLLACDVRFAAPDARMNAAYIRIGVGGCDMGSGYLLPRLVGLSVTSELLLTGRFLQGRARQSNRLGQRYCSRRRTAREGNGICLGDAAGFSHGAAIDQTGAQRPHRRAEPRSGAHDGGPAAGNPAGDA